MDIFATIFNDSVPQNGLTDDPEVQITDDAGTIVQTFVAMTDLVVDGKYVRAFTIPDVARNYTFLVDADPNVTAQVRSADRYYFGAFSGEADIIATSADLVNLDVAVSTRNAVTPLEASVDQGEHDSTQAAVAALVTPLDATTDQAEHDATQAAIAALVVPLEASVDQAEHDATQAAIAAQVVPLDAVTDQAEHDATQAAIAAQVVPLDAVTDQAEHDATQALIVAVGVQGTATLELIEGGRDIDFVGDDVLGWQRIERDTSGVLIRRYNLFDEGGARITGTVAAFNAAGKMISSEVAL